MAIMAIVFVVVLVLIPAIAVHMAKQELEVDLGSYLDTLKIGIDHPGNPDCLYIHTNALIYDGEEYLHGSRHFNEGEHPAIFKELMKIPGVTQVGMKPLDHKYSLSFNKGDAFTYEDDIIDKAVEIIKEFYGKGKNIEMLPTKDNRQMAAMMQDDFEDDRFLDDRDY